MTDEDSESDADRSKQSDGDKKYNLEERTAVFSEQVIDFALTIQRNPVTTPLISQLVKAATSIGANYCEANNAESKRDFRHKIGICRKEALETKYWFRMIARAAPDSKVAARPLWQEARELNLIFSRIWHTSSK